MYHRADHRGRPIRAEVEVAFITGAGRVGRLHYFGVNLACAVGIFAPFLIGSTVDPATGQAEPMPAGAILLTLLLWLVGMWLGTANAIRRLHDRGHSGWLILLGFVPLVGAAFGLYLLFAAGDPLPNRFGPPPGSPDPQAMRAQLAQLEAVTAPYVQQPGGPGGAPAPSAWPVDEPTFDPTSLYRDNPGLGPAPAIDGPPPVYEAPR